MTPNRLFFNLTIAFLLCASIFFHPDTMFAISSVDSSYLRVAVVKDADSVNLRIKGSFRIEALNTGAVLEKGRNLRNTKVIPTIPGLLIGKKDFKVYGVRIKPKKDASVYINKRRFRGLVDIVRTKNLKILVINHIHVEDYLRGVLYHEVSHRWPIEAIKAQAIAARTYALHRRSERKNADYDLTSDVYSQVYGGKTSEKRRTNRAVDSTRGKVLTYKGRLIPAYYHATCGGHTEDADKLWNVDLGALKGRDCPYCRSSPHYRWKAMFSYKQMEERLNRYGLSFKGISFIALGRRDRSGRVETIKLKDTRGVKEIPANTFRLALGANTIRSINFAINITPKGVIFKGRGWGHGVGMCQWGAFGMAKRRYRARDILNYYYPGARIEDYTRVNLFPPPGREY